MTVAPESESQIDRKLEGWLKIFEQAAQEKNTVGKDKLQDTVEELQEAAPVYGIPQDLLDRFLDVVAVNSRLDQGTVSKIIRVLHPRSKIGKSSLVRVVGSLGLGNIKPALPTQVLILRWLVMVYDFLDGYAVIDRLYGTLFSLLDMINLRPFLCHLLSLLTRRKHVRPFRIQYLLELRRNFGAEQPLLGLLHIFKAYYPDVIVGDIGRTKAGLFSHPNPDWLHTTKEIQSRYSAEASLDSSNDMAFRITRRLGEEGVKRRKTRHVALPQASTTGANEHSLTLDDVESAQDLAKTFYKLELPSQLAAALVDPLLQKLISLIPSETSQARINGWLSACLYNEFATPDRPFGRLKEADSGILLTNILRYGRYTKGLLPAVEQFLPELLAAWDGVSQRDLVLGLVSFISIRDFDDLLRTILRPLEQALLGKKESNTKDPLAAARLVVTYADLFRHWIVQYNEGHEEDSGTSKEDLSIAIRKFVQHAGLVCSDVLSEFEHSLLVSDAILCFFESAASTPIHNSLFRLVLPPDSVIFRMFFSNETSSLSRMCGLLERYKTIFSETDKDSQIETYPRSVKDTYNRYLVDVCNALVRNRIFLDAASDTTFNLYLSPYVPFIPLTHKLTEFQSEIVPALSTLATSRSLSLQSVFSISHSPNFATFSSAYFKALQKESRELQAVVKMYHRGPVTQRSLKQLCEESGKGDILSYKDFRIGFLKSLREGGMRGVTDFLFGTVVSVN
ncbi:Mis6-domain-containing protein [Ascobolus immersus RN42]|uniref:Mis6-domain-containing protein n=1 Tax=Ascobolus immersus RN42 TaxID=1160509 RepID=A0A3N4ICQ8_ASCIM|nr:Mis6-domain-containing protein [Ascobolus immersus RN42]